MTARTEALLNRSAAELAPVAEATRHPRMRSWLVFALAVIVAFFGLIYSRISLDRSAFVLEELEREIAEQEAVLGDLRLEVARLRAPERIASIAEEMGLVYPAERISLRLPDGPQRVEIPEYQWARLRSVPAAQP